MVQKSCKQVERRRGKPCKTQHFTNKGKNINPVNVNQLKNLIQVWDFILISVLQLALFRVICFIIACNGDTCPVSLVSDGIENITHWNPDKPFVITAGFETHMTKNSDIFLWVTYSKANLLLKLWATWSHRWMFARDQNNLCRIVTFRI